MDFLLSFRRIFGSLYMSQHMTFTLKFRYLTLNVRYLTFLYFGFNGFIMSRPKTYISSNVVGVTWTFLRFPVPTSLYIM